MDAYGKIAILKNNRGITLVVVAILIFILIAFVGLAVDVGYMYVTKGQLQNAADSAALAGAARMRSVGPPPIANPNDTVQTAARSEAITFAAKNQAARENVVIANDNTNTLSPANDIAVGNWNGAAFNAGVTPVNSIEVKARRTADSPGSSVPLFFTRLFGFERMGAAATAVAALPLKASGYISLCQDTCPDPSVYTFSNPLQINPPRQYDRDPTTPGISSFAWTSLLNSISSVTQISPYLCTTTPYIEVCGQTIWSTQGTASSLFKDMEGAFNDPNFDSANKEFTGSNVSAWWLIVPVVVHDQCNPGNQPAPLNIWGYALIRVISVCDVGGGQPCRPYQSNPCSYPHKIVVDRIACIDCATAANNPGLRATLVR